uniref:Uncharacterized protein n=1 Tax=viral metagenome TaxID=1070528 RepID=A0A6M3JPA5_9ZZZZ
MISERIYNYLKTLKDREQSKAFDINHPIPPYIKNEFVDYIYIEVVIAPSKDCRTYGRYILTFEGHVALAAYEANLK